MTVARRELLSEGEAVYHCISRCVRRAYLCGYDVVTGQSFDHRKQWVLDRLKFLSEIFTIDVLGYALMSTHSHTMVRTRPDLLGGLNDQEVASRWLRLYPPGKDLDEKAYAEHEQNLSRDKLRIAVLRERLGSISWFMKSLNEFIARRANREDDCKGRFWEGRFKAQRLYDEASILSCAVYIDLNPVRAKIARTPEESEFTSAYERINAYRKNAKEESTLWLSPTTDSGSRRGFLTISFPDYLTILDESGREMREGKRGRIPEKLGPILTRIGVRPEHWINTCQHFRKWFSHAVGRAELLRDVARRNNKAWCWGVRVAEKAYL